MKHFRTKRLLGAQNFGSVSRRMIREVESYSPDVGGNRALLLAANFPVSRRSRKLRAGNSRNRQSVAGWDMSAIAKEAEGWLRPHQDQHVEPARNDRSRRCTSPGFWRRKDPGELLDTAPGRVRWSLVPERGDGDPSKALLLVAHLDTVPVDKSRWSVDPFGA